MLYNASLILEGGGMRGAYTAGVLDFFLDEKIDFKSCYGVSAGACHACSYLSKQRGRALRVNVDYMQDKRYCSYRSLIKTGDLFGADFVYNEVPNVLDPFDYDTLKNSKTDFYAVVTNIHTGEAEYLPVKEFLTGNLAVRASSSLPLLSKTVKVDGKEYLDGGIADSIPLRRSIDDGNPYNVVILTQYDQYRKEATKAMRLIKLKYHKYPAFVSKMANRHLRYNETLDFIEEQRRAGGVFVIRPQNPVTIGRIEKDRTKLTALYNSGYSDAKACLQELLCFLEKSGTSN